MPEFSCLDPHAVLIIITRWTIAIVIDRVMRIALYARRAFVVVSLIPRYARDLGQ